MITLPSAKERALIAYLAVVRSPQSRSHLINLLWGSRFEKQARQSLRQVLTQIRRRAGSALCICREEVSLSREVDCDLWQLFALAVEGSETSLVAAVGMTGELLQGLSVEEDLFSGWLAASRAKVTEIQIRCNLQLAEYALADHRARDAVRYAQAAIAIDDFREDAHRVLLTALAADGRSVEALRHGHGLAERFERELGTTLDPQTQDVLSSLQGRTGKTSLECVFDLPAGKHAAPCRIESAGRADLGLSLPILRSAELAGSFPDGKPDAVMCPTWSERPSLAVFPFTVSSHAHEHEFVARYLKEDIVIALARTRAFRVIDFMSFLPESAKEANNLRSQAQLGCGYGLRGSVGRCGDNIRIAAELIHMPSACVVWGERYLVPCQDLTNAPEAICRSICASSHTQLLLHESRLAALQQPDQRPGQFAQAWRWYYEIDSALSAGAWRTALQLAELYPRSARPWQMLAIILNYRLLSGHVAFTEEAKYALLTFAHRAVEFGEDDEYSHDALACALSKLGRIEEAIEAIEFGLTLNPNCTLLCGPYSYFLAYSGRTEEAVTVAETSLNYDPYEPGCSRLTALAMAHFVAGDYESAVKNARKAARRRPGWIDGPILWAASAAAVRSPDLSSATCHLLSHHPTFRVTELSGQAYQFHFQHRSDADRLQALLLEAGLPA